MISPIIIISNLPSPNIELATSADERNSTEDVSDWCPRLMDLLFADCGGIVIKKSDLPSLFKDFQSALEVLQTGFGTSYEVLWKYFGNTLDWL